MIRFIFSILLITASFFVRADDGYRLWLRYDKIKDRNILLQYQAEITSFNFYGSSPTLTAAKNELNAGLQGLMGKKIPENIAGSIIIGATSDPFIKSLLVKDNTNDLGKEGFIIRTRLITRGNKILIAANTDVGVLYGVFHFLRLLQTHQDIKHLSILSIPKIQYRIMDHWDNLNRTVERGYAGISIWNWHQLPDYIDQRYIDYARANASIGINGSVLTNVNANALSLTKEYLVKFAALANAFRPYGIKVYLTPRFSAPIEIGGLKTADPLNAEVQAWWKQKADEIYRYIPDFGGFLVKANSEGQPGPQTYGRTHSDGANMLADALAPHNGIVIWRAFVYDVAGSKDLASSDRFKQAFNEFKPLDGQFRKNVIVQVKNGPIDFQPREPISPLFGAMTQTPLFIEFQLTLEYLGQGTHLVYEAPLFKEVLDENTVNTSINNFQITGIAAVANIGNDRNWTSQPFGQANWYAIGRLAWDHDLSSAQIADEWIRQTFSNDKQVVNTIEKIMLTSREAVVNYMTPLGLHHIMATGHHYGPGPWVSNAGRADWNPIYYHRADSFGIGFDRTAAGSNALSQYKPQVADQWKDSNTCDDKYLLWFHHVSWSHKMHSGKNLWQELCAKYLEGVDSVRWMQQKWNSLKNNIDSEMFNQVKMFLSIQEKDAVWWRNACLLYFQTFSKMPLPQGYEKPDHTLEYYKSLKFPYAPGNGGNM